MNSRLQHLDLIASAPDGVKRLRELILELAVRGKLVPQDPNDEPASELLKRIQAEKARLVAEGKIRKDKTLPAIGEEEKPFELPAGWEWVRLGEIAHAITKGATPTTYGHAYQNQGINFVNVENITGGRIAKETINQFISEEADGMLSRSRLAQGDILFSIAGTIGRTCLVMQDDLPANTNQALAIIKGTSSALQADYLIIQLDSLVGDSTRGRARGGAMNNVSLGDLTELVITLPPLAEQQRIVAKVDELMALCGRLEAQQTSGSKAHSTLVKALLDALSQSQSAADFITQWQRIAQHFDTLFSTEASIDALKQTILRLAVMGRLVPQDPNDEPASELLKRIQAEKVRLVAEGKIKKDKPLPAIAEDDKPYALPAGWEWSRLQSCFDVRDGTHDTPKYQPTGFPLVTSKNIYGGRLCLDDVKFISEADHRQISERSRVDRGDILFAMIGSIGNPVIVDVDTEFSIKNVALVKYYARFLASPEYLRIYLAVIADEMKAKSAGGVQSFVSLGFTDGIESNVTL